MGKILESIGIIDGHDIIAIGKIKAKKDKLFTEIFHFAIVSIEVHVANMTYLE